MLYEWHLILYFLIIIRIRFFTFFVSKFITATFLNIAVAMYSNNFWKRPNIQIPLSKWFFIHVLILYFLLLLVSTLPQEQVRTIIKVYAYKEIILISNCISYRVNIGFSVYVQIKLPLENLNQNLGPYRLLNMTIWLQLHHGPAFRIH